MYVGMGARMLGLAGIYLKKPK
jgi:hypothetical protein